MDEPLGDVVVGQRRGHSDHDQQHAEREQPRAEVHVECDDRSRPVLPALQTSRPRVYYRPPAFLGHRFPPSLVLFAPDPTASAGVVVMIGDPLWDHDHTLISVLKTRAWRREISDFRPAAQLHVELPAGARLDALDELDVDDLAPVGTEEPLRIEPLFETAERAAEQRTNVAPVQPHVVALGDDQGHFVERHEPAACAVANEQSLDDLRRPWERRRRNGPRARASAPASRSGSIGLSR